MKSLMARVDDVVESVNSLKASLEISQYDIQELQPFAPELDEAKDEIDQLNSDLVQQELSPPEIRPEGGFQLRNPNPDFMDFLCTLRNPKKYLQIWNPDFKTLIQILQSSAP